MKYLKLTQKTFPFAVGAWCLFILVMDATGSWPLTRLGAIAMDLCTLIYIANWALTMRDAERWHKLVDRQAEVIDSHSDAMESLSNALNDAGTALFLTNVAHWQLMTHSVGFSQELASEFREACQMKNLDVVLALAPQVQAEFCRIHGLENPPSPTVN